IDTISGSGTIAFIYYLYNNGKISSEDIDGLEPKWGEIEPALEMIKKISFREGFGDILAEGSNAVGEKFNISGNEIATALGMEVPYHDLRQTYGMAIAYSVGSPRGPCHTACDMYMILLGLPLQEFGLKMIDRYNDGKEMAKNCALAYDYRALYSSLPMCIFANPLPSMVLDMIKTSTGLDLTFEDFKKMGERIYFIKRLFNLKMGLTPKDEILPKILLNPVQEGGSAGKSPDFEKLKQAFYMFRKINPETGYPSKDKLKELGLLNLIN
ncbi:MAG: aldehyde ferredoxin oxidoreductase C-terminal domain-containing protein, partial [Candidatus Lokiarchaeota archaeon]